MRPQGREMPLFEMRERALIGKLPKAPLNGARPSLIIIIIFIVPIVVFIEIAASIEHVHEAIAGSIKREPRLELSARGLPDEPPQHARKPDAHKGEHLTAAGEFVLWIEEDEP